MGRAVREDAGQHSVLSRIAKERGLRRDGLEPRIAGTVPPALNAASTGIRLGRSGARQIPPQPHRATAAPDIQ